MKVNLENILKEYPFNFDLDLMISKGLGTPDGGNGRFIKILNNYKMIFEKYLLTRTSLKELDDELVNSPLKFVPINESENDYYKSTSTMGLKFLYMRNNLHVERLDEDDIQVLEGFNPDDLEKDSNQYFGLIERTYREVIMPIKPNEETDKTLFCYSLVDAERFYIDVRNLVIGVRYDTYNENGMNEDEWSNNYFKQVAFLNEFMKRVETTVSKELLFPTSCVQYDEFTVCDNYSYYK